MNERAAISAKWLRGLATAAAWASGMLFAVSLALPEVRIIAHGGQQDLIGWFVLLYGWGWVGNGQPAWLANPFLWSAWLCQALSKYSPALTFALLSLAVAFGLFLGVPGLEGQRGGYMVQIMSGYYFWIGSILLASLAATLGFASRRYDAQVLPSAGGGTSMPER